MGETLTFEYDKVGDFLFLDVCKPYAEQDSDGIDDGIIGRFNLETGEIETVEILFFFAWLTKESEIRIPVSAVLWPVNTAAPNFDAPSSMDSYLTIRYDQPTDNLALEQRPPHLGQRETEIVKDATARLNPETGEIECLEIRGFKAQVERDGEIVLPINAIMRPVKHTVAAD